MNEALELNGEQRAWLILCLVLSVLAILLPLLRQFARFARRMITGRRARRRAPRSRFLVWSAALVLSVWCLRFAVGYYSICAVEGGTGLYWWEELMNSLIHALQTFSLDEDYTLYIKDGKAMMEALAGAGAFWPGAYGLYASVLNVVAPIAGGAFLFEVLAGIFPRVGLLLARLRIWKPKYYFSELNDASLALAKNILNERPVGLRARFCGPIVVFTDVYVDNSEERSAERLAEAKQIGAICLRDDLSHICLNKWGEKRLMLMDADESENLQAYLNVVDAMGKKRVRGTEIDLFTNSDAYVLLEKSVRKKMLEEWKLKEKDLPIFFSVHSYRNLILNVLTEIPLYEPLIGKRRNADGTVDLTVTIVGMGGIGLEMFRTVYWLGQMLDCNMTVNVLSQETEASFWDKIDSISPEIRHTLQENDPILRYNDGEDGVSPVYCRVRYWQCDVETSGFVERFGREGVLLQTDYFFISLGSDEKNLTAAERLKMYIGRDHAERGSADHGTVIAYIIYDPILSDALNRERRVRCVDGDRADLYLYAAGNLRDLYSVNNVFMSQADRNAALNIHEEYCAARGNDKKFLREFEEKYRKDPYIYWANIARAKHLAYKAFSIGQVKRSVFEDPQMADRECRREYYKEVFVQCCRFLGRKGEPAAAPEEEEEHKALLHRLAWLEHRRWNAFLRACGFRCPREYEHYKPVSHSYKFIDLKLHPCIVECSTHGILAEFDEGYKVNRGTCLQRKDSSRYDHLDRLSYDLKEKGWNDYDFKQYDYWEEDFGQFGQTDKGK
ncbi:MAG TPA: hypothetical protein H9737_05985 [Candidatus Borkfalkia faecigallinarum]|uniref:Uncharacterized protein n=1 Tax=Candidatus Borkfalkia faecigallinarum TaxID=2838509 RepID=A0A9D1VUI1_9FIRM|nr:hypothetical protein [Candidatus Borkfalkia faecigallinarum]